MKHKIKNLIKKIKSVKTKILSKLRKIGEF